MGASTLLHNVKSGPHDLPRTINSIKCLGSAAATSDNSYGVILSSRGYDEISTLQRKKKKKNKKKKKKKRC